MRSDCSDRRGASRADQQSYVESGATSLTSDVRAAGFLRITADEPNYASEIAMRPWPNSEAMARRAVASSPPSPEPPRTGEGSPVNSS